MANTKKHKDEIITRFSFEPNGKGGYKCYRNGIPADDSIGQYIRQWEKLAEWYRSTKDRKYSVDRRAMDKFWDSECDEIITKYVKKYGVNYSAFYGDIRKEIQLKKGVLIHLNSKAQGTHPIFPLFNVEMNFRRRTFAII